jgi:uncharacterized protein
MNDRIGPTSRPDDQPVSRNGKTTQPVSNLGARNGKTTQPAGFQKWKKLLFLHWQVPVEELRSLIPDALTIDTFEGAAYVGVVPFVMEDVRPSWWPKALAFNFLETNVRTYVHLDGQPGVYFLSLDASSRLAVWAARVGWSLPYFFSDMHIEQDQNEIQYTASRRSKPHPKLSAKYRVGKEIGPSQPDTLEFFLLERYLMFVERQGGIQVGQVYHTPYIAHEVELISVEDELVHAAGLAEQKEQPHCAHYVELVNAEIFPLRASGKQ